MIAGTVSERAVNTVPPSIPCARGEGNSDRLGRLARMFIGSLRTLTQKNICATIPLMDKEIIARVVSEVERIARGVGFGQVTIVIEKGRPRWIEAGTREWLTSRARARRRVGQELKWHHPPGHSLLDDEQARRSAGSRGSAAVLNDASQAVGSRQHRHR